MRSLLIAISALVTVSLPAQQSRYRDTLFQVQTARNVTYGSALSIKTNQMVDNMFYIPACFIPFGISNIFTA